MTPNNRKKNERKLPNFQQFQEDLCKQIAAKNGIDLSEAKTVWVERPRFQMIMKEQSEYEPVRLLAVDLAGNKYTYVVTEWNPETGEAKTIAIGKVKLESLPVVASSSTPKPKRSHLRTAKKTNFRNTGSL